MRRFKATAENPLTEISELQVFVEEASELADVFTVFSDVRIAPAIEEVRGRDFRYGPRRATLRFTVQGCQTTKVPRFNDTPPEASSMSETVSQTVRTEKSAGLDMNGGFDVGQASLTPSISTKASLAAKTQAVTEVARVSTNKVTNKFVKPLPNLRWEIQSRNCDDLSSFLSDSYLTGQEMFSAGVTEGSNHVTILGTLYCRKKDFGVVAVERKRGDGFFGANNREAIMNLVIQKAMKDADTACGMLGEEFLVLSECVVTDMD